MTVRTAGTGLMLALLAAGLAPWTVTAAHAQRLSKVTGAQLVKLCMARDTTGCDAYISGIADAIDLLQRQSPEPHDAMHMVACIPPATSGQWLLATVIGYGQGHEGEQKLPAAVMVASALKANYPCKAGQPS